MRAGIIGVAAACLVAPVAVLLSPLTPVGLARLAEPDPGFAVDAATLILGTISVLLLTIAASAIPALTAARTANAARRTHHAADVRRDAGSRCSSPVSAVTQPGRPAPSRWATGLGHPCPVLINARHMSVMWTTPRRPVSPATGR